MRPRLTYFSLPCCSNCGKVMAGTVTGLGLNGKHLCGECLLDPQVLEEFMAEGSQAARTIIGQITGLSGGAVAKS